METYATLQGCRDIHFNIMYKLVLQLHLKHNGVSNNEKKNTGKKVTLLFSFGKNATAS